MVEMTEEARARLARRLGFREPTPLEKKLGFRPSGRADRRISREEVERKAREEAERKAREEAERKRVAEEKARLEAVRIQQEAIQKQRELARKRAQEIQREKAAVEKLRALTSQQKKQFFQEQRQIQETLSLQKLREKGKVLTTKAQEQIRKGEKIIERKTEEAIKEIEEKEGKEVIIQRQIDTFKGIPILETVVLNEKTGAERKPTPEEEKLIRETSLTVLPAKTRDDIFVEVKKSFTPTFGTPEFKNFVGFVLAKSNLTANELDNELFKLRDVKGKRLFTTREQASLSRKLVTEIAKGFVAGAVTGRAIKLLGVGAKALGKIPRVKIVSESFSKSVNPAVRNLFPKVLTEGEKKILGKAGQVGLIGGLTALETKAILNTAKTKGKKEAILQMIGLTAFLRGASIGAKDFKKLSPKQKALVKKEIKKFELNIVKTQDKKTLELLNKFNIKVSKELKSFKGVTRAKKIGKIPGKIKTLGAKPRIEKIRIKELNPQERTELFSKKAREFRISLEKKFKKVLSEKDRVELEVKIRKILREKSKGKTISILDKEIIQAKKPFLKRIANEFKQFKGIKRIKKIKRLPKKIKKELLQFKGVTRAKKIKKVSKKISKKIKRELKQFKGVSRVKKIKKIPGKLKRLGAKPSIEKISFRKLTSVEKNKLIKDSSKKLIDRLEKKFNKVLSQKDRSILDKKLRETIKNKLNAGDPIIKLEREFIRAKKPFAKRFVKELKQFKGIKRIRKIKRIPKKVKIISKKLKQRIKRTKLVKELKQFKGVKRIKKIKRIPKKIKRKIFPKKTKVREVVRLDQLAFQGKKEEIKIISKRIAGALEKRSGVKLNTANREKLIKRLNQEITKRSTSKLELNKFKNQLKNLLRSGKKEIVSFKFVKEKPRISKRKIRPSRPDKIKPLFKVTKIKEPKVSRKVRRPGQQQLLLEPKTKIKIREKVKVFQILEPKQIKVLQKSAKIKQRQLQQIKIKQKSASKQKLKMETQVKVLQRDLIKIKAVPRFKIKQDQLIKSLSSIRSDIKILSKSIGKSQSKSKILVKDLIKIKTKIKAPQKAKLKILPPVSVGAPIPLLRRKPVRKKVIVKKKQESYNVRARPIRKPGQKKRPKLRKVNRVPLTKRKAKDLRNYITDTSLSRTALIKKAKKGVKPKTPILKVPKNYARKTSKKFRTHRIVKGKRRPLRKGTVIEKRTRLLDTKQERQKITLRKRIKQITPKVRVKKSTKRTTIKSPKRKVSQKVLDNLAEGRKKRLDDLKKKR